MRVEAERILIVLLGAIGDVTRALPLAQRLRHGYPKAHIAWAVEPASAGLLENHPAINQLAIFQRRGGAKEFLRFLGEIRGVRPNLSVDLQRHLKSGITSMIAGAPVRLGFARQNSREANWVFNNQHIEPQPHFSLKLHQFLRFADWLELEATPIDFGLRLTPVEEERVAGLLGDLATPFLAAFVGSSCDSRLWFPDRTAAVASAFAKRGIGTVLVGGPGDVGFAEQVMAAARVPIHNLTGKTQLRDLVGIFRRSVGAWGPDSGPMHIAAAAGARVVSLWGATSAKRSAPWGSDDLVVEGPAPCSPCYKKHCDIGQICMQNIAVDTVVERIEQASR